MVLSMTPDEFVVAFVEGWTRSQPDGFIEFFRPLCHPEVIADQPLLPAAVGPEAYMASFRSTFALLRDMHPQVLTTACTEDTAFIESHVTATIGGRQVSFDVADRFELRDGLIYRRQAFFDPTPIIIGVLLRPRVLPTVIRGIRGH
jgi:ketosteroid isomerase-like protein